MLAVLQSTLPIFLLILLGQGLKRAGLMSDDGWSGLDRLCFFVLYPVLLFSAIVRADFSAIEVDVLLGSIVAALSVVAGGTLLISRSMIERGWVAHGEFSSIFQTVIRWNGFIALAIAEQLLPANAMAIIALVMAAIVLPVNVVAVFVVSRYADANADLKKIAFRTITNPIVLGCLAALAMRYLPPLPAFINASLDLLSAGALGLGLLGIGAGLHIRDLLRPRFATAYPTIIKLWVYPMLTLGMAMILGVSSTDWVTIVLCAAVPTAMNGYTVARQLGGDAELYAAIVTAQTAMAFVSIPFWLAVATYLAG